VKVKSFPGPRVLAATVAQGRHLLRVFGRLVVSYRLFGLGMLLLAVVLFALIYPLDYRLLATLHFWQHGPKAAAQGVAFTLGTWGDYPTYNVPLALLIWLYGVWKKSTAWRRIAVVCFLGATLAGMFDDCFRLSLGRPRPDAHVPDAFYGLGYALQGRYQSFPSGHAASVFGTACSLLVVCRPLGIMTTLYAIAVAWARMEIYRHYPSDVAVGSVIGIYFGVMIGWAAQVRPAGRHRPPGGTIPKKPASLDPRA
jgi:membrane-associated phospholipid phosphatase